MTVSAEMISDQMVGIHIDCNIKEGYAEIKKANVRMSFAEAEKFLTQEGWNVAKKKGRYEVSKSKQ